MRSPLSLAGMVLLALAISIHPALAKKWNVDIVKSPIVFVGSQGGAAFEGKFPIYYADIDFNPNDPKDGHLRVTVEMPHATTGDKQRDSALHQKEWFDSKGWPQAEFVALTITKSGGDGFVAEGTLTIKGNIRPVKLPFRLVPDKDFIRLQGTLTLNRHDFNIGEGEWVSDQIVGKDVKVIVDTIMY